MVNGLFPDFRDCDVSVYCAKLPIREVNARRAGHPAPRLSIIENSLRSTGLGSSDPSPGSGPTHPSYSGRFVASCKVAFTHPSYSNIFLASCEAALTHRRLTQPVHKHAAFGERISTHNQSKSTSTTPRWLPSTALLSMHTMSERKVQDTLPSSEVRVVVVIGILVTD